MQNEVKNCPICGSTELKRIGTETQDGQVYGIYKCMACDSAVSSYRKPKAKSDLLESSGANVDSSIRTAIVNVASDVYKKVINSTIVVICRNSDGNYSCGTGTVVSSKGFIVTNAHVVTELSQNHRTIVNFCDDIQGESGTGSYHFEAELVYADPEVDLALLQTSPSSSLVPVELAKYQLEPGQAAYAIGNSKGEGLCIVEGIVSDAHRYIGKNECVMISAPVTHGNSGGPVFDANGCLIGIVKSGRADVSAMNYAIPNKDLERFLRLACERERVVL